MKLKIGDPAPMFAAATTDGAQVKLSDYFGTKLVLYFYPMDDTPGCTKQACSLRDHHQDIRAKGADVLGVSTQDVASHQRFTEKFQLNFPL
ncbi:MAG: peroxiredoxin, partial [Candidatus Competibacter sp.]|nr:peroxiredoxin [Candidatus Competibacter sp.]